MVQLKLSDVSKHLNVDLLQNAFKLKTQSDDTIKSVEVRQAVAAGEGLIGAVYRIIVVGHHYKTSFIAKVLVSDLLLRRTLNGPAYSKREAVFYLKVLPTLLTLQKSLNAKESLQNNVPVCYGSYIDGQDDYLLLEDLAESFCGSVSEPTEHLRNNTLKVLAHLHAVSAALRIKKPDVYNEIANQLHEVYYNEYNRKWYSPYLQNAIDIDIETLAQFEDPTTSKYFKKFIDLVKNNVYEQLIHLSTDKCQNSVFCHGDAWLPNFLYSKKRSVAIDFQILRCASPVTDLCYILTLCCNQSCTKDDYVKAIKLYYDEFEYYLSDMEIKAGDVLSWKVFNEEIKKYGKFGLLAALTTIPLLDSERCEFSKKFDDKFGEAPPKRIPLEDIWILTPLKTDKYKQLLVNAVRVTADVGLI